MTMRKENSVLKENNKKSIRKTWRDLYYYMRYWLIYYEKDTRYSNYELKMEQIPIYVQVLANIRQTPVKYKIIIITKVYLKIILLLAYILYLYLLLSYNFEIEI